MKLLENKRLSYDEQMCEFSMTRDQFLSFKIQSITKYGGVKFLTNKLPKAINN